MKRGSHLSKETKRTISKTRMGMRFTEEHKGHMSEAHTGIKRGSQSKEHKRKLSKAHRGKHRTEETKKKMSKIQGGSGNGFYNKHHSEGARTKMSLAKMGEKNWNWKGGLRRLYPCGWTKLLKESIRTRDNYKCQVCGCPQEECLIKLSVHHVDYDKNNLDPNNLISLCQCCHTKIHMDAISYYTAKTMPPITLGGN